MSYQAVPRGETDGNESRYTTFTLSLLTSTRVASDPRWHLEWLWCIINGSPITSNRVDTDFHSYQRTQGHDQRIPAAHPSFLSWWHHDWARRQPLVYRSREQRVSEREDWAHHHCRHDQRVFTLIRQRGWRH